MHITYKLIALSVVFGFVLTSPTSITAESFDDLSNDFTENFEDTDEDTKAYVDESRTADVVVPGIELLPVLLGLIPSIIAGLKAKALKIAAVVIKCLAPKTIFLALGAIAAFAFCKITNLCSVAYNPVVYDLVPSELRSFVTPERLEDAQEFLISALKQYAKGSIDDLMR